MKKSIRFRITFIFIAIMGLLIGALCLINRFLMPVYYMNEKVKVLENTFTSINDIFVEYGAESIDLSDESLAYGDPDVSAIASIIRTSSERSNIDIILLDTESNIAAGVSREREWLVMKLKAYLEFSDVFTEGKIPDSKYQELKRTDDYVVQTNFDPRSGYQNLECWGTFPGQTISFLMVMPVQSISENTSINNRFILMAGIAVLIFGSVVIYLATDFITKPINQLAVISTKMSNLDFTEKYTGNSQDEIGVLGESMNTMSNTLEETILDLQKANEKLKEDIDLKEKIDTMRKDFISNVSHELKTPIALIEGYAEGLVEGIAEDPDSREYYCHVIMDEAQKMNRLVRQLTHLTQYEFGEADLNREEFDLRELLENVLSREKIRLDEKEAVLEKNFDEDLRVNADEFKIEEVFTNFLSNALNHLDGKKRIIINAGKTENGKVRLSVYNDGQPIPEGALERIWEKFYKVDKARTRSYGGSGIGLSIVKAIANAHQAECGVRNLEEGVEFYITLDGIT